MNHICRVASVLAVAAFSLIGLCSSTTPLTSPAPTAKPERNQPTTMPETLKRGVVRHKGSQSPPEGIGITQVKVLGAPAKSGVWIGVTNIKLNSGDKQLVFCFSGYGTFDFDFRESASDPILGITFPSDEEWEIYQGFEWQGRKYGSWGMLLPGKADLSYPPGAFRSSMRMTAPKRDPISLQAEEVNWSAIERLIPLTQLWLDGDKITAMRFGSDSDNPLVFRIVRDRGYVHESGQGTVTASAGEKVVPRSVKQAVLSPEQAKSAESTINGDSDNAFREMARKDVRFVQACLPVARKAMDEYWPLLKSDRARAMCGIAGALVQAGAGAEGKQILTEVLTATPKDEFALRHITACYARIGDMNGANATINRIKNPECRVWARIDMAVTLYQIGRVEESKQAFSLAKLDAAGIDPSGAEPSPPQGLVRSDASGNRAFSERDISIAQAKLGLLEEARLTASGIHHQSIREVAESVIKIAEIKGTAVSGNLETAQQMAARIQDAYVAASAYREIATTQATQGDLAGAKATLARASERAQQAAPEFLSWRATREIAIVSSTVHALAGDFDAADASSATIKVSDEERISAERSVAQIRSKHGKRDELLRWASMVQDAGVRLARIEGLLQGLATEHASMPTTLADKTEFTITDFKARINGTKETNDTSVVLLPGWTAPEKASSTRTSSVVQRARQLAANKIGYAEKYDDGSIIVAEGDIEFIDGKSSIWSPGAVHIIGDTIRIGGYTFASDEVEPLVFQVSSEKGYVYIKGRGTVTNVSGESTMLPRAESGMTRPNATLPSTVAGPEAREIREREALKEFPDSQAIQDALKVMDVTTSAPELSRTKAATYTVQPADTLFSIAKNELGDAKRWEDIHTLNKDVIGDNPLNIHIGQVLKIPARKARDRVVNLGHGTEQLTVPEDLELRDIIDLVEENQIEVETYGSGIQKVDLRVRRLASHPVGLRVPVGTFFVSDGQFSQDMITTRESKLALTVDCWVALSVDSACANRWRGIPEKWNTFTIQRSPHHDELAKLMPALDLAYANWTTRQAAVWIVTDDATYSHLGILVRQPVSSAHAETRAIQEAEAAAAMKICDEAGIDITRKRIWGDRIDILKGLKGDDLRRWFERKNVP